jgi:hypothetical protein
VGQEIFDRPALACAGSLETRRRNLVNDLEQSLEFALGLVEELCSGCGPGHAVKIFGAGQPLQGHRSRCVSAVIGATTPWGAPPLGENDPDDRRNGEDGQRNRSDKGALCEQFTDSGLIPPISAGEDDQIQRNDSANHSSHQAADHEIEHRPTV